MDAMRKHLFGFVVVDFCFVCFDWFGLVLVLVFGFGFLSCLQESQEKVFCFCFCKNFAMSR